MTNDNIVNSKENMAACMPPNDVPGYITYYVPVHFSLSELVDPQTLEALGERAWLLFDPKLLITADRLRERYGKAIVNTYMLKSYKGKKLRYRGFRPATYNHGAAYSQHRFGRALDMNFYDVDVETVRRDILNNPYDTTFEFITEIESDVSWLHFGVRNHCKLDNGILVIQP